MEVTAFVKDADRFDVTVDEPDPERRLSDWPVNVVVRTSEQLMGHRLKLYLSFPAASSLVRQLARELHEAGHESGVSLTGEDRKTELRAIADRLLGLAGADDDLVEEAEREEAGRVVGIPVSDFPRVNARPEGIEPE